MLTITCPPRVSAGLRPGRPHPQHRGFTSVNATPLIDMYALDGIRLITKSIRTAVYQGSNVGGPLRDGHGRPLRRHQLR